MERRKCTDGYSTMAVNGSDFGMLIFYASKAGTADLCDDTDYSYAVGEINANISTRYSTESEGTYYIVHLLGAKLPNEVTLSGLNGHDEIVLISD